jgi:hypothetical protein
MEKRFGGFDVEEDHCSDVLARAQKYYQQPLRDLKLNPDAYKLDLDWSAGDVAAEIPLPGHVAGCLGKRKKPETKVFRIIL